MGLSVPIYKLMILLAIALAANLDNLGIGTAYGITQRRIANGSNLLIALMAVGLTYAAMAFGRVLVMILPAWVANWVGAIVIALVGVWIYWEAPFRRLGRRFYVWLRERLHQKPRSRTLPASPPPTASTAQRRSRQGSPPASLQPIGCKETLILGLSLALNAMAGGLGASLSGHNPVITSIAVGVFSYLTIAIGQAIAGTYLSKHLGALAPKLAGLLLIAIGIYEIFD